jgi:hypothetical protein
MVMIIDATSLQMNYFYNYSLFEWKSKMKVHIFHPIYWMDPWMDENLVAFAISHSYFGN